MYCLKAKNGFYIFEPFKKSKRKPRKNLNVKKKKKPKCVTVAICDLQSIRYYLSLHRKRIYSYKILLCSLVIFLFLECLIVEEFWNIGYAV